MKIPFDIKYRPQIESGEYKVVIEYDNRTFYARIVCWDFNGTELLACVNYGDEEDVLEYNSSGKHIGKSVGRPDLIIIAPEPELSEFEKAVRDVASYAISLSATEPDKPIAEFAKEYAQKLLELAKNEILSHESLVEYAEKAREEGKAEALKDLPRWRKADVHRFVGPSIMYDEHGFYIATITKPRCRYITYESLRMLNGFNE